jgi:hypothetical protein
VEESRIEAVQHRADRGIAADEPVIRSHRGV